MRLVLLRHGQAVDRAEWSGPEPLRPLTTAGRARTKRVVRTVAPLMHGMLAVWTSPWSRANATARLAAKAWNLPLEEHGWLAGGLLGAGDRLDLLPRQDTVLVGHEPDFGELIAALTGGPIIPLKKAGIAVLEGSPWGGGMVLRMLLTPAAVLDLA